MDLAKVDGAGNKLASIVYAQEPTCLKDPAIPRVTNEIKPGKPDFDLDRASTAMSSMATFLSSQKLPLSPEALRKSPVVSYLISCHPDKAAAAANFGYKKKAFTPEDLHTALAQEIVEKLPLISKLESRLGISKPGRITLKVIDPGLKTESLKNATSAFALESVKEGLISAARQNSYVAALLPQYSNIKQQVNPMDDVYKAIHAAKLHQGSTCCVHVKDN